MIFKLLFGLLKKYPKPFLCVGQKIKIKIIVLRRRTLCATMTVLKNEIGSYIHMSNAQRRIRKHTIFLKIFGESANMLTNTVISTLLTCDRL